jgi:hypothetical protein
MGLSIYSKSKYEYHYPYSGLSRIRFVAFIISGGKLDFADFIQHLKYDWAYQVMSINFPNLVFHSDCEGSYTLKGKIGGKDLMTGNSKELLKELRCLRRGFKKISIDDDGYTKRILDDLYKLVNDVVKNHDGRIRFC